MALISHDQLAKPGAASILLIAPPKVGKTSSLATIHRVLRLSKRPTKIAFFDFDDDGAEPFLRLARDGYESMADAIAKRNRIDPWTNDIRLHRFKTKGLRVKEGIQPGRRQEIATSLIREFNEYIDWLSPDGNWKDPEKALGAIIFDSITGMADILEDFTLDMRGREIGGEKEKAVTFNDWRLIGEKITEFYQNAKTLPNTYVICTAHIETRQEIISGLPASGGRAGIEPIATHQLLDLPLVPSLILRDRIAKDFSIILYPQSEDRRWRTSPNRQQRSAGSRLKDGLASMVDPDFKEVLDF